MRLIRSSALAALFLAGLVLASTAVGGDKGKTFAVPKNAVSGTVKSVNEKKATFTITTAKGKERTFEVDAKTQFLGPKGGDRGTGAKGLNDDCMAPGYEIKVMPRKDGKTAKDVFLPERKSAK
jgi:hypothetical protein